MDPLILIGTVVGLVIGIAVGYVLGGRGPKPVTPADTEKEATPPPSTLKALPSDAALELLSILQREARFVDFVEEDVAGYSDAQIGAAARVVHEGARKALREHFALERVRSENEGSRVSLPAGFDASEVKLTGNVSGQAPFSGTLRHGGWKVTSVKLPEVARDHDSRIVAPAEVEL